MDAEEDFNRQVHRHKDQLTGLVAVEREEVDDRQRRQIRDVQLLTVAVRHKPGARAYHALKVEAIVREHSPFAAQYAEEES